MRLALGRLLEIVGGVDCHGCRMDRRWVLT